VFNKALLIGASFVFMAASAVQSYFVGSYAALGSIQFWGFLMLALVAAIGCLLTHRIDQMATDIQRIIQVAAEPGKSSLHAVDHTERLDSAGSAL
jgi:hypothetical protein